MKAILLGLVFVIFLVPVLAQSDEISAATGLPIPIGAPVIYGQVAIRNLPKGERRPTVVVSLRVSGIQVDKYRAGDSGYWFFLKRPEEGMMLVFEIDGQELGQATIIGAFNTRFRQDAEFDWNALRGATKTATGVVSVRDQYPREKDRQREYEKAFAVSQSGPPVEALKLFDAIVQKDPKDHNAWMVIGTLHYAGKRYDEARKAFTKAIELKPDYFLANLNLGKLELGQKQYDAAIAAFAKAVEIDAASPDANHLLGESYLQVKKGSLAVVYLQKAIELAPIAKAEVHLRLAALYNAAGYKDRAQPNIKLFLRK